MDVTNTLRSFCCQKTYIVIRKGYMLMSSIRNNTDQPIAFVSGIIKPILPLDGVDCIITVLSIGYTHLERLRSSIIDNDHYSLQRTILIKLLHCKDLYFIIKALVARVISPLLRQTKQHQATRQTNNNINNIVCKSFLSANETKSIKCGRRRICSLLKIDRNF